MAIKMLSSIAGDTWSAIPGEEVTHLSAAEEKRYVEAGLAEAVEKPKAKKKK